MRKSGYKKFGVGLDDNEKRQAIETAARAVLERVGYHQATVQQIIEEAGISRRTFYAYYQSKEDVVSRIMGNFLERAQVLRELEDPATLNSVDELRAQIERIGSAMISLLNDNRDVLRVFFDALAIPNDRLSPAAHALLEAITFFVQSYVEKAAAKGFLYNVDARLTSLTLMGIYLEIARRVATKTAPESVETWVEEIITFIDRGVIRPPN